MNIITDLFGIVMNYLLSFNHNYFITIILFAVLAKLVFVPLNIVVQKNSIKMIKLQPEVNRIKALYINDKDKAAEEQLNLYKREKYNALTGAIPMLLQVPIIIAVINVVYNPLSYLYSVSQELIDKLTVVINEIKGIDIHGSAAQVEVVKYLQELENTQELTKVINTNSDLAKIVQEISMTEFTFLNINLLETPMLDMNISSWILVLFIVFTSFLLAVLQNKVNILQREQSKFAQNSMTLFLCLFCLFFVFLVPMSIGIYWAVGNIIGIIVMYILNWVYKPENYIDYIELEKSKKELEIAKKSLGKYAPITREEKRKAKIDYKKFFDLDNDDKELVFFSGAGGTYKYFKAVIENILENSDIVVHYVTSDIKDDVFNKDNPNFIPYFIQGNDLIYFFMKLETKVFVMTMPEIHKYQYKKSIACKSINYMYMFHGIASHNLLLKKGALDHYDTIFSVGPYQTDELKAEEDFYKINPRKIVHGGYPLIDDTLKAVEILNNGNSNSQVNIMIAPSWHEDNLLENCIDMIIEELVGNNYIIRLRPHPEYVKRYSGKIQTLIDKYENKYENEFSFDLDYNSNSTVFSSDILITDWSTVCYEFSFATKKPTLFINTPMKIMNPDYKDIDIEPYDLKVRKDLGENIEVSQINTINNIINDFINRKEDYKNKIEEVMNYSLYNIGNSSNVEAKYIIDEIISKRK